MPFENVAHMKRENPIKRTHFHSPFEGAPKFYGGIFVGSAGSEENSVERYQQFHRVRLGSAVRDNGKLEIFNKII